MPGEVLIYYIQHALILIIPIYLMFIRGLIYYYYKKTKIKELFINKSILLIF